jgi:hypothetical protein
MQDFQQRVIDERAALVEKIDNLAQFTGAAMFANLPADEKERLYRQLDIMNQYASVLGERIQNFAL